jgi:hypothetical protein
MNNLARKHTYAPAEGYVCRIGVSAQGRACGDQTLIE